MKLDPAFSAKSLEKSKFDKEEYRAVSKREDALLIICRIRAKLIVWINSRIVHDLQRPLSYDIGIFRPCFCTGKQEASKYTRIQRVLVQEQSNAY